MRFLRRLAGFLGLAKDEGHEVKDEGEDVIDADVDRVDANVPRKGFSVPVKVAVDRPQMGPVLVSCGVDNGGVQGLRWYARRLKIDEDGDVADEFLDEILPVAVSSTEGQHQQFPRFVAKNSDSARPARVRSQVLAPNGKVRQSVEFQGSLQWV